MLGANCVNPSQNRKHCGKKYPLALKYTKQTVNRRTDKKQIITQTPHDHLTERSGLKSIFLTLSLPESVMETLRGF